MGALEPAGLQQLRESFAKVYDGPDLLRREYEMVQEAKRMEMPLDSYRRLYELRLQVPLSPLPKFQWQKWWKVPVDYLGWFVNLPSGEKGALVRRGIKEAIQKSVLITAGFAIIHYVWEIPARQKQALEQKKQAEYQAWQIVTSSQGEQVSGGRIEALQALNEDKVDLAELTAKKANLAGITLKEAQLKLADLQNANLANANLEKAVLQRATLLGAYLVNARMQGSCLHGAYLQRAELSDTKLQKAYLQYADLNGTDLHGADLSGADLSEADLSEADLSEANLRNAVLKNVNLKDAKVVNAQFGNNLGISEDIRRALEKRGAKFEEQDSPGKGFWLGFWGIEVWKPSNGCGKS